MNDRRILFTEPECAIYSNWFTDDGVAEFVGSHDLYAILKARWQATVDANRYRLLDWEVTGLVLDGRQLLSDADLPPDFPMQQIVNALYRREVRELLESHGPTARRAQ
jgi:hypothetical protein